MCDIKSKEIDDNQSSPDKGEQSLGPPEYFVVGRVDVFLVDFTLELPYLLSFLVKIYPPPEPD